MADMRRYFETKLGQIYLGDSLDLMRCNVSDKSVDLIMTSPPFGLVRKKEYGNVDAHDYLDWFRPFAEQFKRVLKDSGSLVIDIGGAWIPGQPTRSLYHYRLLIMLCDEYGFHLAQDYFWWNPSKLPTPAEWVNIRRIRVKDAVNCVWWLSPTPWPKASNERVLQPYSDSMRELLRTGYKAMMRPSGHDISTKFARDNGASIPPNLIAIANTESNSHYLRYCRERGIRPNPARFPAALPEYFVRMLTDPEDLVLDPWAGSCVTGEVSERLGRRWLCGEIVEEYVAGALARFVQSTASQTTEEHGQETYYRIPRPGILWNGQESDPLDQQGGRSRPTTVPSPLTQTQSEEIVTWQGPDGIEQQVVKVRLLGDKKPKADTTMPQSQEDLCPDDDVLTHGNDEQDPNTLE
jgi:DNA modification methylase